MAVQLSRRNPISVTMPDDGQDRQRHRPQGAGYRHADRNNGGNQDRLVREDELKEGLEQSGQITGLPPVLKASKNGVSCLFDAHKEGYNLRLLGNKEARELRQLWAAAGTQSL